MTSERFLTAAGSGPADAGPVGSESQREDGVEGGASEGRWRDAAPVQVNVFVL